jgi:small subunit ribosomal protein S20
MANTRKSAKRARQNVKRNGTNQVVRASTRSTLRLAAAAILAKDVAKAKETYAAAIKALSKAASKGALPRRRAARKISRLTLLLKKSLPDALTASK